MTSAMMQTNDVMHILEATQAVRYGHFRLPSGRHTGVYYQIPLALRYYNNYRTLCVGLSRVLRLAPEVAAVLPHCSIVSPSSGGIPVGFGVREALRADQIFWTERDPLGILKFRQFAEVQKGDRCILVDDLMVTGRTMQELIELVERGGGVVVAIGVIVDARVGGVDFGNVPVHSLVDVETHHYDEQECPECRRGDKVVDVEY